MNSLDSQQPYPLCTALQIFSFLRLTVADKSGVIKIDLLGWDCTGFKVEVDKTYIFWLLKRDKTNEFGIGFHTCLFTIIREITGQGKLDVRDIVPLIL